MSFALTQVDLLAGLILFISCPFSHKHCEFMSKYLCNELFSALGICLRMKQMAHSVLWLLAFWGIITIISIVTPHFSPLPAMNKYFCFPFFISALAIVCLLVFISAILRKNEISKKFSISFPRWLRWGYCHCPWLTFTTWQQNFMGEFNAYLNHQTWEVQAGIDLDALSLLDSFHSIENCDEY